ncbi:hypothetical protein [Clostridium peptidivorans]|uniref:hypothetical protein n=1 Tax=Clostridium peptidivorans TaxID=100174 RepID=UPI000BE2BB45|nr:hypothetical protein [Clostridium peptidivorans]
MFQLYFNKKKKELKIAPLKNLMIDKSKITNEVTRFNDCYFVSLNRKALKDKANAIKEEWIKEVEEELNQFKNLKIQVKY